MILRISSHHSGELLSHAAAQPAHEVCGLLLGHRQADGGVVTALVPAANVAADPARSFEIDPATLLATHRQARGAGAQVIGHWHSHPGGRLAPSRRDAARATNNGQFWIIIANAAIGAWVARARAGGPAQFEPVAIAAH
jgi:proteasome lid subunit RPN8/RPN11